MTSERIKEIQKQTAYPESVSVMIALKQVWNECEQGKNKYSVEEVEPLLSFIRDVKDDWDCDNDSHKYGTSCRCCDAEKTLEQFKKK